MPVSARSSSRHRGCTRTARTMRTLFTGAAAGGAVTQHLRHPQVLINIGRALIASGAWRCSSHLIALRASGGPWRGVAWGHLAGAGEIGFMAAAVVDGRPRRLQSQPAPNSRHWSHSRRRYLRPERAFLYSSRLDRRRVVRAMMRGIKSNRQCISLYNCLYLATILGKNPFHRGASSMRTNTQTKRELDKIDRNILRILQTDGRISFTELGEKVGLPPPRAVHRAGTVAGARMDHRWATTHGSTPAFEGEVCWCICRDQPRLQIRRHL